MKKTLKTALASILAASLAASAAAFGSSAAAPDRSFADTDTAYAQLSEGDSGDIKEYIPIDWSKNGIVLSMDIKTQDGGNNRLDFVTSFSMSDGKALQFEIYRDQQVLLRYGGINYYYYDLKKLNTLFAEVFNFNEWHNYKVNIISDGTLITDIVFTIDGKELTPSRPVSELIAAIGVQTVTWCEIKHRTAENDVFYLDNFSIAGKDKTLTVDFEKSAGIFTEFAEITKVGNGIYGDLNQNGELDIIDLIKLKKLSVASDVVITNDCNALADMVDDSIINALDVAALRKALILK